jgi:hypothetical protein
MAAPGITLSVDGVVITPSNELGYTTLTPDCNVGTIEDIGSGVVAEWAIGDNVFYKNRYPFTDGVDSWDIVDKSDILFLIIPV